MTARLSTAELRKRREARQKAKGRVGHSLNKNGKLQHSPPPAPFSRIERQRERVAWSLTRVRSARSKLAIHRDDPVWQAAYAARRAEYERELLALERLTT